LAFEWDQSKASANRRKHGVDFADVVGVFENPLALTAADAFRSEERFVTLGQDFLGRLLVVSWTLRGENIRVISARAATPAERRDYQEGATDA
jgi:uncharacterized DUF497 family protein